MQKPADLTIRNSRTALQFALKPGTPIKLNSGGTGTQPGKLFITFADALGAKGYDWRGGIVHSLSIEEIADFASATDTMYMIDDVSTTSIIYLDRGSSVCITHPDKDRFEMRCVDEKHKIAVELSDSQLRAIRVFLDAAMVRILGWL